MVKKKSKIKRNLSIGIFIVFLVIIGVISMQFSVPSNDLPPGTFISVPTYGTLSCSASGEEIRVPSSGWKQFDHLVISCGTFTGQDLPQECDVTFKLPSESEIGSRTSVKNSGLSWSICTSGTNCNIGTGDVFNSGDQGVVRKLFNNIEQNLNKEITINLKENQFILAEYQESGVFGSSKLVSKGKVAVSLELWRIKRNDIFSVETNRFLPNSEDCVISSQTQEIKYAIKSSTGGLTSRLENSKVLNANSLQGRNSVLTYISGFVARPPQFNLFDDDSKYCTNKNIYRVDRVDTNIGYYLVAHTDVNGVIKEVDCCSKGDCNVNERCEDFKCVEIVGDEECSLFDPCPLPAWTPKESKVVVRQECVDNKCVVKERTVACSSSSDCPGGICDFDVLNPSNNECKTIDPVLTCGNGLCEMSLGETSITCSKDCEEKETNLTIVYILLGVLAFLIFTLIMVIAVRKK